MCVCVCMCVYRVRTSKSAPKLAIQFRKLVVAARVTQQQAGLVGHKKNLRSHLKRNFRSVQQQVNRSKTGTPTPSCDGSVRSRRLVRTERTHGTTCAGRCTAARRVRVRKLKQMKPSKPSTSALCSGAFLVRNRGLALAR